MSSVFCRVVSLSLASHFVEQFKPKLQCCRNELEHCVIALSLVDDKHFLGENEPNAEVFHLKPLDNGRRPRLYKAARSWFQNNLECFVVSCTEKKEFTRTRCLQFFGIFIFALTPLWMQNNLCQFYFACTLKWGKSVLNSPFETLADWFHDPNASESRIR